MHFSKKCTFKKGMAVGQSCLLPLWLSVSFAQMEWHSSKSGAATVGKFWSNKIYFLRLFYFPAGTCEVKWNLLRPRGEENWCTTTQQGQLTKMCWLNNKPKYNPIRCADSISQNILFPQNCITWSTNSKDLYPLFTKIYHMKYKL